MCISLFSVRGIAEPMLVCTFSMSACRLSVPLRLEPSDRQRRRHSFASIKGIVSLTTPFVCSMHTRFNGGTETKCTFNIERCVTCSCVFRHRSNRSSAEKSSRPYLSRSAAPGRGATLCMPVESKAEMRASECILMKRGKDVESTGSQPLAHSAATCIVAST